MPRKKNLEFDQVSSVDVAAEYCDRMLKREVRGPGDVEPALRRIEAKTGISYWTLWGLRYRRPKSIATDLFRQIRGAYFAICEKELRKLEHELAIEATKGGNDDLSDLVAETQTLAARLKALSAEGSR